MVGRNKEEEEEGCLPLRLVRLAGSTNGNVNAFRRRLLRLLFLFTFVPFFFLYFSSSSLLAPWAVDHDCYLLTRVYIILMP